MSSNLAEHLTVCTETSLHLYITVAYVMLFRWSRRSLSRPSIQPSQRMEGPHQTYAHVFSSLQLRSPRLFAIRPSSIVDSPRLDTLSRARSSTWTAGDQKYTTRSSMCRITVHDRHVKVRPVARPHAPAYTCADGSLEFARSIAGRRLLRRLSSFDASRPGSSKYSSSRGAPPLIPSSKVSIALTRGSVASSQLPMCPHSRSSPFPAASHASCQQPPSSSSQRPVPLLIVS